MLITNHVLSGAVVGVLSPNTLSALAGGFVSHFVLDVVPHYGVDDEHLMRIAVPDGLLGLAAIGAVAAAAPAPDRVRVLAGVFGACLPDVDKPAVQFVGSSPFPAWFDDFHTRIQSESPQRFWVEIVAALSCAALLVATFGVRFPVIR